MNSQILSFEGIEACGKSTQIALLATYLENKKIPVLKVREPGGTPFGEQLRTLVKTVWNPPLHVATQALVFAAARSELLSKVVLPFLQSEPKGVVLMDRYYDSSLAYQHEVKSLVENIHLHPPLDFRPLKTIYLRLGLEVSLKRAHERGALDVFEQQDLNHQKRWIAEFDQLAEKMPERFIIIDAEGDINKIHQSIIDELAPLGWWP